MTRVEQQIWPEAIGEMQQQIRDAVIAGRTAPAATAVVDRAPGDVIFAIDRLAENVLLDFCENELARRFSVTLIAEGLAGDRGTRFGPRKGSGPSYRLIIDPVDGSRLLMYDKRSAWVLTGVARDRGEQTSLADIFFAMQTEIPPSKQQLGDVLYAFAGGPLHAQRQNLKTRQSSPLHLAPSQAATLEQGFASFVHFFPGGKERIARIDEQFIRSTLPPGDGNYPLVFEEQYLSTGGQIYELLSGHDRFIADLRGLIRRAACRPTEVPALACHPYDLCTASLARAAGAIITSPAGAEIVCPLDTTTDLSWVGYANKQLQKLLEPVLQEVLRAAGLI